ncbi:MAG: hypothetical protein DSZ11_05775 [Sulfurovum sp.]|nr:MAG: hypothetical protein DSZ11_05775 [Sulfurovum sp.]
MKTVWMILFLGVMVFANTQPYKKEIVVTTIDKPSLVRVKIDRELYKHTSQNYPSLRLQSSQGVEGYFVKSYQSKSVANQKMLKATTYERENAKLTYHFDKPFEIEKIELNIEDRDFESLFDIYIDGKMVVQKYKIFDYTQETGNRNFSVTIPKQKAKEVSIVYHLDKTTSFYKKYRDIKKLSQYLTIKSVTFFNNNRIQRVWESSTVELFSVETKNRQTSYIFNIEGTPTDSIHPNVVEKNFKRTGKIYSSEDLKRWNLVKEFTISASTLAQKNSQDISLKSRVKYLKLVIENQDNKALNIKRLSLQTEPQYLYFIANPKESYQLYFGDKNLTKPSYEVESLVDVNSPFIEANFLDMERLEVTKLSNEVSFFEKNRDIIFIMVIFLALGVMGYIAFGLLRR